jgi:hypothetical protein
MARYGGQYDPSEMQQAAGGNPFYNPMQPTADWSQGIRTMLNGMWAFKEQQRKELEARQKWDAEFGLKKQETAGNVARDQAYANYYNEGGHQPAQKPAPNRVSVKAIMKSVGMPQQQIDALDSLSDQDVAGIQTDLYKRFAEKPAAEKAPSAEDRKLSGLDKLLKTGKINQDQYNQAAYGLKALGATGGVDKGAEQTRKFTKNGISKMYAGVASDANIGLVSDLNPFGFTPGSIKAWISKHGGQRPTVPDGYSLDMPKEYNEALAQIKSGVGNERDQSVVDKWNKHRAIFDAQSQRFPTFDAFMRSGNGAITDPEVDKSVIKFWYDLYRR